MPKCKKIGVTKRQYSPSSMPPKTNIVFEGKAGDNFGGLNQGSKIVLNGDAGRFVGNGMKGGEIIINGCLLYTSPSPRD